MYLGSFTLGQFVPLTRLALGAGFTPAWPVTVPIYRVYDGTGVCVATGRLPPGDLIGAVGHFAGDLRLQGDYAAGHYAVVLDVTMGGVARQTTGRFQIVPGGDADGAVISQHFYRRPQADFVVQRLDSSQRVLAQNPTE
jgi:hypothetical protein